MFLPFAYSTGWATGAAAASPVTLSGIESGDELLAIIKWAPGAAAEPVAVATFVVADGEIESASVATDTYKLLVIWKTP